ncbi:MAG TPA: hypothetical protein VIL49_10200 [Capillimicrobium sp.]
MARVDETGAAYAGSQLQTQLYVNRRADQLGDAIRAELPELSGATLTWRSPLAADRYREYYGQAFLDRVGLGEHAAALKAFWPPRGPQWDALAVVELPGSGRPGVLLCEGKSYPGELLGGSGTTAAPGSESRQLIEKSLAWTQQRLGVEGKTGADWATSPVYQSANRLATLQWLRSLGVRAWLVHLLFVDDPHGPTTPDEWGAAVRQADEMLGLSGPVPGAGHVLLPAGRQEELAHG